MDDETKPQTERTDFAMSKDFLLLVPLVGSALAVTFDVGYFSGINITLFTFFALTEHIVFALEVFPGAVLGALVIGLFIFYSQPVKAALRGASAIIQGLISVFLLCSVGFVVWVSFFFFELPSIALGSLVASVFLVQVINFKNPLGRAIFGFAAATVVAYTLGYALAAPVSLRPSAVVKYFEGHVMTTTIETKSGDNIDAKLLRSGDRGVLFLDTKTKHVTLLRWDEIKQISTGQAQ
jgi:hypothetical protein